MGEIIINFQIHQVHIWFKWKGGLSSALLFPCMDISLFLKHSVFTVNGKFIKYKEEKDKTTLSFTSWHEAIKEHLQAKDLSFFDKGTKFQDNNDIKVH